MLANVSRADRPKQHHYVPQGYLKRFGRDSRVAVRWRDRLETMVTHVKNIAGQTGFYDTYKGDVRSVEVEQKLAEIDARAHAAIEAILEAEQIPGAASKHRNALARFLAVQMTRTPEARQRWTFTADVVRYAGGRTIDEALVSDYLEIVHLGFRPGDGEIQGALTLVQYMASGPLMTQTELMKMFMTQARRYAPVVFRKHWSLEITGPLTFVTSDAPLVLWRTPNDRDDFSGVGLANADEIRFPIDPHHQLVLTDTERCQVTKVDTARVATCNQDLASACHRFIIGHPDEQNALLQLTLADRRPTVRFNLAPLYEPGSDGIARPVAGKDVLHQWVQRDDLPPRKAPTRRR